MFGIKKNTKNSKGSSGQRPAEDGLMLCPSVTSPMERMKLYVRKKLSSQSGSTECGVQRSNGF